MNFYSLIVLFFLCSGSYGAGVLTTENPPVSTDDGEVEIESVSESLMSSNIFDIGKGTENKPQSPSDLSDIDGWTPDTSPIFKAIRDFIFQASDGILEATEGPPDDPTEELVKIIEKGLIEATTMFLTPSDDEDLSTSTVEASPDPITILKIEEESPNTMLDRIGINILDIPNKRQTLSAMTNSTTACSNCYESLESCVQQCFSKHNCHDVQRQVRMCPTPPTRLCNFFTQWSPVDECKVHDDCKSPLLCCSDGCVHKCSPGDWRH